VEVYRTGLAEVISEYIGETEKNLVRVFDTVKGGDTMLLFHETDGLFGQRTDIGEDVTR